MSRASAPVLEDLELYTRIYRKMLLIRGFEDLVQLLFLKGEVYDTTHLYSGQEAVATGFASLLEDRDRVAATYRGHGRRGEGLMEVETDKATVVYEAEEDGTIEAILVSEGAPQGRDPRRQPRALPRAQAPVHARGRR